MRRWLPALLLAASCTPDALPPEPTASCGSDLDCVAPEICVQSSCVPPAADPCAPQVTCDASCVDVRSDPRHCGACNAACPDGQGCVDGACCGEATPSACAGACVDVTSDARHCGLCGAPCADDQLCSSGTCCGAGLTYCDWACRDLSSDPLACGACDTPCAVGAACVGGVCTACPAGTEPAVCGASTVCLDPALPRDPCMARIPGGTFTMGIGTPRDTSESAPAHEVTLTHDFLLDVTEVSQAAYQACLDAGGCTPLELTLIDRDPLLPAVFVSFVQAEAFCAFRGARLPTEAEWERAARADDDRCFPWGEEGCDPPPPEGPPAGCHLGTFVDCEGQLTQVGRKRGGASRERLLDLSGNAREWVADWFARYGADPVTDPTGPETGTLQISRGGDYTHNAIDGAGMQRKTQFLDRWSESLGFRCAKDLP